MMRRVVVLALFALLAIDGVAARSFRLRYMSLNIGNVSTKCWKSKVCDPKVPQNVQKFIQQYQPDIVLLSEVCEAKQMKGSVNCWSNPSKDTSLSGPILPEGYDFECGESIDESGKPINARVDGATSEHECVAWKRSRVKYNGFKKQINPRAQQCNADFTGVRVDLQVKEAEFNISAITAHPPSLMASLTGTVTTFKRCDRHGFIRRIWRELVNKGGNNLIAGDFNDKESLYDEEGKPLGFKINFSQGNYWDIWDNKPSKSSSDLDHAFSSFGLPDTKVFPMGGMIGDEKDGTVIGKTLLGRELRARQIGNVCSDNWTGSVGQLLTPCDHPVMMFDMIVRA